MLNFLHSVSFSNLQQVEMTATVLRYGQPTLGMRLDGNVIVQAPQDVHLDRVREWVACCVLTRVRPCADLHVFFDFGGI